METNNKTTTTFKANGTYARTNGLERMNVAGGTVATPAKPNLAAVVKAPAAPAPKKAPPAPGSFSLKSVASKATEKAGAVDAVKMPKPGDSTFVGLDKIAPAVAPEPKPEPKVVAPTPDNSEDSVAATTVEEIAVTANEEEPAPTVESEAGATQVESEIALEALSGSETPAGVVSNIPDDAIPPAMKPLALDDFDESQELSEGDEDTGVTTISAGEQPNFSIVPWAELQRAAGITVALTPWIQKCIKSVASHPAQILAMNEDPAMRFYNFYKAGARRYHVVLGRGELVTAVEINMSTGEVNDASSILLKIEGAIAFGNPDNPAAFYCERERKPVVI